MSEEKKPVRDLAVGAPAPATRIEIQPFRNDPRVLTEIMAQPKEKIAELITGALAQTQDGWMVVGGRLIQGALKGQFMEQAAREIRGLIERGKIPEDYASKKYGFETLAELLKFIDEEEVDEERLLAVQALFLAVNSVDTNDGQRVVNYQLFKLAKRLTSSELLTLKTAYAFFLEVGDRAETSAHKWLIAIAERQGHDVLSLVEAAEDTLLRERLLTARQHPDRSGILPKNARLTDLGIRFCRSIEELEVLRREA